MLLTTLVLSRYANPESPCVCRDTLMFYGPSAAYKTEWELTSYGLAQAKKLGGVAAFEAFCFVDRGRLYLWRPSLGFAQCTP
jgi:hypothetical protein